MPLSTCLRHNQRNYILFVIVLALASALLTFLYGPLHEYPGWDYVFHYRRFYALADALRSGLFPHYIDYPLLEGYGYLTKTFYPDLILLPFAALSIVTGVHFAYEFMLFSMTFLSGLFMFHMVKVIFKNNFSAYVSAFLYSFCVYRIYDVYDRAALGEAMSFTFVPLVFLGLYYIIAGNPKKWYVFTIGFSLLIYTHVLSTVLTCVTVFIILIIYCKQLLKDKKRFYYLILSAFVCLLIASYFIFPLLEQMHGRTYYYNENVDGDYTKRSSVNLGMLVLALLSGAYYSKDALFCGPGIILCVGILIRFFISRKWSEDGLLRLADIGTLIGIVYIFCSTSFFPWHHDAFSWLRIIQFPWRLYEFVSFFFSISIAYYLYLICKTKNKKLLAVIVLIVLTIVGLMIHYSHYRHLVEKNRVDNLYEMVEYPPSIENKYNLVGMDYLPSRFPSVNYALERGDVIESFLHTTLITDINRYKNILYADVHVESSDSLILPLIYYKGYCVTINGQNLHTDESTSGLVQVKTEFSGKLEAYYCGTTLQHITWYISLISVIGLCVYIFIRRKS